jgi:hypothetical protein
MVPVGNQIAEYLRFAGVPVEVSVEHISAGPERLGWA